MSISEQLDQDLKAALVAKDVKLASTLRMLKNALNNRHKEKQTPLREEEMVSVLQREAKQRRESIESFRAGSREDLVLQEEEELAIIERYLPDPLSADELEQLVEEAINKTGAEQPQDIGDVMAYVMKNAEGQVDGAVASQLAKKRLGG